MPRASWKGFLRLSLVSCPIYLSPATTRTKSIRLKGPSLERPVAPIPAVRRHASNRQDSTPKLSFAARETSVARDPR